MNKLLTNKKRFTNLIFSIFILLLGFNVSWGQQTLGSFPYMDGGFEGQTATLAGSTIPGTLSTSAWSVSSTTNSSTRFFILDAATARTGNKYANHVTSSTTVRLQSPSTATSGAGPAVNTQYTVQYYFKTTTDPATGLNAGGIYNDGTNSKVAASTIVGTWSATSWTKAYSTITTHATQITPYAATGFGAVRTAIASNNLYDDFVIYPGAYDNSAPTAPATPITNTVASATTYTLGWTASTDTDKTGYMVVRYTTNPSANAQAIPNVNGIYAVGNTIPNGGITGTVVYVNTDTSFTDTVPPSGTTYYYRIFTVDKAFNYSSPLDYTDTTPPGIAGTVTISNATTSAQDVSWVAASSVDGGGYMVVRYATNPNSDNDPTQKTSYTAGSTYTNGTGSLTGTVIYVGTNLTVTDSSLTPGTTYYYKVYTFDQIRNYSAESSASGTTVSGVVVDLTPPNAPGIFTLISKTDTSLNLSWLASSTTGADLTGYLLVRYSSSPALETGANPATGTTYAIGDTYATGTPTSGNAKIGTVVYTGTNLTFTDTNLTAGTNYYYKVYAYDAARNYSTPSTDSPFNAKTRSFLATPVATAATSTLTGFTANWQHVTNAASYSLYLYTAATPTNIVGWTFPNSWTGVSNYLVTADVANTNNATKQFSLSTGTLSSGTGVTASASDYAASAATFYTTNQSTGAVITTPVKWFQVDANTTGFSNIKVSSSMFGNSATSPKNFKLQYSITGPTGTFSDVTGGAITCQNGAWVSLTDLVLPSVCENNPNVSLRWAQVDFTDISGNQMINASSSTRIDNIYIKGTAYTSVSGYPQTVTVTGTPAAGDTLSSTLTLSTYGTYYYDVVANPGASSSAYVSSLHSNVINAAYIDNVPPTNPGTVTVNGATSSGLTVNWAAATNGTEGGGYMVVRYASNPNADNDPTQKAVYVAGNTITNGTGSLTGTVVYVGTNLTATDSNLSPGATYYYKVYTLDQATNYSDESTGSGTTLAATLTAPVATASTTPTTTGFTANWGAVTNASNYNLYLYTANTQSNLVGWTFPVSGTTLTADITSANNLTNTIVQSAGTISSGIGATTQAISAASWYQAIGKYWEVTVNTTGNYNIKVSSKLLSTAPRDFKLQYKIGTTGTYTDVTNGAFICSNDWTTGVLKDISLPAECNNQASVFLRWINYTNIDYTTGLAMTGGTARLDDVYIKGSTLTQESGYPVTVSGTSKALSGLTAGTHYYDVIANGDGAIYSSSPKSNVISSSIVPTVNAGAVTVNGATASSLAVNWGAASRVDGGGYMVVRYASNPNADNDPAQRITYIAGNTYANGTGTLSGTVVYVGTNLTATDTNLSPGATYYYKVYAFDQDHDYSDESTGSGTTLAATLTAPVATASTLPTTTGFTANWGAVTNASNYDLYLYNANTPSTIVGWNFDTNLVATATSANNTNNAVVQSKGTAQLGTVSTNTCVTATTSAWVPTGTTPSGTNWEIVVNTVGFRNTTVSSKMYASQAASAARDFKLQYRVGASSASNDYADVPSGAIIVAKDWTTGVLNNLALPAACDNQTTVYLRWINYTTTATDGVSTITSGGISLDDVYVKGNILNIESGYPVAVSETSKVLTGLSVGTHYYDVIAKGDGVAYISSAKSNLITSSVTIDQSIADYKSIGDASTSNITNWNYFDGVSWLVATAVPTSSNNVTVSSGNEVTLGAGFEVGSGKTMTVNGTINLAGNVVSGAGNFILNSGASLKLGDNISLTTAITTTNNLSTAANYYYNGSTVAQHTGGLPGSTLGAPSSTNGAVNYTTILTGNVIISNPTGVTLQQGIRINTPGTVSVTSTGKLLFGDGEVASSTQSSQNFNSGTFNINGNGGFVANSGCTLSITSSKGISGTTDGNIKNTGTRTFGSGINYIFAKNDLFNPISIGTSFGSEINTATGIRDLTVKCPLGVFLASSYTTATVGTAFTANCINTYTYTATNDITINGTLNLVSGKLFTSNYVTVVKNSPVPVPVNSVDYYPIVSTTITPGTTNTKTVIIGTSGIITGAGSTTGWVVGDLKKLTSSGNSPSFDYAIGDATKYSPLYLTFSGNTTATGGLTARTTSGVAPNIADSGIDNAKKVNRYWTLTNSSLAGFGTYQANLNYATSENDDSTSASSYQVRRYDNSTWTATSTVGTPTSNSTIASGITGFGNLSVGGIITSGPAANDQSFCGSATVADLLPSSGTSFKWYLNATGGTALDASTPLASGNYYVSLTIPGFDETSRTSIAVSVNDNPSASVINVSTIADLQTAVDTSNCGDIIILADGHYDDTTLNITRSNITVMAATNGGVYLDGVNDINITGNYVKFKGFQFTSGDIGTSYLIDVLGSHNTLSQLNFSGYQAKKFIEIAPETQYNVVEYCNISKLADDNELEVGCAIQIRTSFTTPGYHKIRYCSFQNFDGTGGDYGNEPIRIGLSTENYNKSRSIVEHCYFNNTGLGDNETVSIKSQENTVRFCTFTNQQNAMLSFRNGDNNVAYSNFFINAGGIRVKEANNIYCYNNYFQNSGVTSGAFNADAVTYVYDTSTYPVVINNVNFVHNTFYNCADIDFGGIGATNNTWANNIFKKDSGSIFRNANAGTTFVGNIYQGTLGITIDSGMLNTDPLLTLNSDNYYGLLSNSPAIDAANSNYPAMLHIPNIDDDSSLLYDISGQSRPASATSKDVGCDEFGTETTTNHPLAITEVGPTYLGGPSFSSVVNLKLILQGYYDADVQAMRPVMLNQGEGSSDTDVDTITVELHDEFGSMAASATGVLQTDGTITLNFTPVTGDYYLVVSHRNTLTTSSASLVSFAAGVATNYDFSTAASQVYGDNQIEVAPGVFAMYTGDLNQDGYIDAVDYPLFDSDNLSGASGNYATDMNGDGYVDAVDYPIFDFNNLNGVTSYLPY